MSWCVDHASSLPSPCLRNCQRMPTFANIYLFIYFSYLISFTYFRHASPNAIRRAKLWQSSVFSTCTPKTISPRPQERRRTIGGEEHGVLCIMQQCVYTCLARQSPSNETITIDLFSSISAV